MQLLNLENKYSKKKNDSDFSNLTFENSFSDLEKAFNIRETLKAQTLTKDEMFLVKLSMESYLKDTSSLRFENNQDDKQTLIYRNENFIKETLVNFLNFILNLFKSSSSSSGGGGSGDTKTIEKESEKIPSVEKVDIEAEVDALRNKKYEVSSYGLIQSFRATTPEEAIEEIDRAINRTRKVFEILETIEKHLSVIGRTEKPSTNEEFCDFLLKIFPKIVIGQNTHKHAEEFEKKAEIKLSEVVSYSIPHEWNIDSKNFVFFISNKKILRFKEPRGDARRAGHFFLKISEDYHVSKVVAGLERLKTFFESLEMFNRHFTEIVEEFLNKVAKFPENEELPKDTMCYHLGAMFLKNFINFFRNNLTILENINTNIEVFKKWEKVSQDFHTKNG